MITREDSIPDFAYLFVGCVCLEINVGPGGVSGGCSGKRLQEYVKFIWNLTSLTGGYYL